MAAFAARVDQVVAVDGKTSRRSHARSKGRDPLHLVSAWASRQRLVLGQEAVAGKSNEITAIPLLLERLELAGALVTIDAIGCQSKIAQAILAKRADYLLAVKANWPSLQAEIERYDGGFLDAQNTHRAVMITRDQHLVAVIGPFELRLETGVVLDDQQLAHIGCILAH
mgnify:CR=1 FL=1